MRKLSLFVLFAVALTGFSFTSCEKEDVSKHTLIIRNWTLVSEKIAGTEQLNSGCERDNVWNFKSDKSYTIDPKVTCEDSERLQVGVWSLNEDATVITLDDSEWDVTISANEMVMRRSLIGIETLRTFK